MKITSLEIHNFMAISHANLRLDDRRLVLVSGKNNDDTSQESNGSGKSSILDALSWCLYGITAREEIGDRVVNRIAKKDCCVAVELDDNGNRYMVKRFRKDARNKNRLVLMRYDHGAWSTLTAGTDKLTQAKISKIVGCSAEVFNSSVYIGQEQMPNLPAMTDKTLKLLIEEAAGIDRLQAAYSESCNRKNLKQTTLHDSNLAFQSLEVRTSDMEATIKGTETSLEAWDKQHSIRIGEAVNAIKQRKQEYTRDESDFRKKYCKGIDGIRDDIAAAKAKIDAVSDEKKEEESLRKLTVEAERKWSSASTFIEVEANTVKRNSERLRSIDSVIGKKCGECGKVYSKGDVEEARICAVDTLVRVKEVDRLTRSNAEKVRLEAQKLNKELSDFRSGMTDVSSAAEELNKAQRNLSAYQTEESDLARRKKQLLTDFEGAKQLKAESNPFVSLLSSQKKQLTDISSLREAAKAEMIIAEKDLELATAVTTVYGQSGVRAHILDTVTPFLNERTSTYLTQLSDGNITAQWSTLTKNAKGDLKEKFSIEVSSTTGAATFKGLSGGEKRKVRLSCSMALQDLVSSRATKPIELYVCDEVDDALDTAGLERLMNLLEEKARERGTVLVVSHNDLASWINQVAVVTKQNGFATVKSAALCE